MTRNKTHDARQGPTPRGATYATRPARVLISLVMAVLVVTAAVWLEACDRGGGGQIGDTTSSTSEQDAQSGDVRGVVGEKIIVGPAVVTVRALQSTFQPAMPAQRLSESTPSAPEVGESFYQAYVRVENKAETPLRVDPQDFICRIGDKVVSIEPTRSGPEARSLLKNTSLDLLLTFEGPAGYQPELIYTPAWRDGVISIGPEVEQVEETTTT